MEMNLTARERLLSKLNKEDLADIAMISSQKMHSSMFSLEDRIRAFGTKLICEQIIKER